MLAFPMQALTKRFDPSAEWRVNFFRVEGVAEPRFYSSWQPTHTPQPNFHVPEAFGVLRFQKSRERAAAWAKKDRLAGVED
jgi:alpha-galactosidase